MSEKIIYKIENKINSKCYVGQTTQGFTVRYRGNWWKRCNISLKNAVKKYGKENFIITILEEVEDEKLLDDLEIKYIEKYNSLAPNGYNLREGGGSRGKHTLESRKKISAALKGRVFPYMKKPRSPETGQNISKGKKGKSNGREGYQHSEESKKKISLSNMGKLGPNLGKKFSKGTKEKMKQAWMKRKEEGKICGMTGKNHSAETKKKIRQSNVGQKRSEEAKKNIKASRGFLKDPAVRKKISDSVKRYYANRRKENG